MFNINSKEYIDPTTKIKLTKKDLEDNLSELLDFKNIEELYGSETTVGRIIANLVIYNITDGISKADKIREYEKLNMPKEKIAQKIATELKMFQRSTETNIRHKFTYKNYAFDSSKINGLYNELSSLLIKDEISTYAAEQFINNLNWLGFTGIPYLNPSMDILSLSATPEIEKLKKDTLEKHKDIISEGNAIKFNSIVEPELLKQASIILDEKKSTGKIIYDTGYNGSFGNNYKITAIFRGVVPKSDDPSQFSIGTSSLTNGISKDEIALAGDIAVQGSIGRAIQTRVGGYLVKQFNAGLQSVVADDYGTDCKTPYTLKVEITEKNYSEYMYRYAVVRGQILQLDEKTKAQFVGKTVDMRSPFYCQSIKICNKCLGDMVYKLGIRNIGLTMSNIGSALMNGVTYRSPY